MSWRAGSPVTTRSRSSKNSRAAASEASSQERGGRCGDGQRCRATSFLGRPPAVLGYSHPQPSPSASTAKPSQSNSKFEEVALTQTTEVAYRRHHRRVGARVGEAWAVERGYLHALPNPLPDVDLRTEVRVQKDGFVRVGGGGLLGAAGACPSPGAGPQLASGDRGAPGGIRDRPPREELRPAGVVIGAGLQPSSTGAGASASRMLSRPLRGQGPSDVPSDRQRPLCAPVAVRRSDPWCQAGSSCLHGLRTPRSRPLRRRHGPARSRRCCRFGSR
jgi:hypothetical protein